MKRCLFCLMLAWASVTARAELTLPGMFCDGMVLQRDRPVPVWGRAVAGETVTIEFAGQTKFSRADARGRWRVTLDAMLGSAEARSLIVRTTGAGLTLHNVVVGEVWFCSGQSNMATTLHERGHAAEEQALPANPSLRFFTFRRQYAETPRSDIKDGRWYAAGPATVSYTYATAYYFGKRLQPALNVPVGLIQAAWGGTMIQGWMSREMLAGDPELDAIAESGLAANRQGLRTNDVFLAGGGDPKKLPWPDWRTAQTPTWLFNGMVGPFTPCGIRGVIWYQGEHNVSDPQPYGKMFQTMIRGWRTAWGEQDLPFYFCQLPGTKQATTDAGKLALMRFQQAKALVLPGTGMAVLYDTAEEQNNHPNNKQPAGERLALMALAKTYGKAVEYSGPTYAGMSVEGDTVRARFAHVGGGLVARALPAEYRPISNKPETKPLVRTSPGSELEGFQVRASDGTWHWANAQIEGETVLVKVAHVLQPQAVRYGWADFGFFNLFNKAGLPAAPFASDLGDKP